MGAVDQTAGPALDAPLKACASADRSEATEKRWDGFVSIWCHTPADLRARLHPSAVAALELGDVLLLESYKPKQLEYETGGPPTAELMMTLAAVREELADLELLDAEEKLREVHEGKYHDGLSAALQVVARKP